MPRLVDHEQRRRDIVDATWTVIADEGYEAASMRRIAEEAGCTTGQITHYFEAKDDILVAVLTESHDAGLRRLSADLDAAGSDLELITEAVVDSLPLDQERAREWKAWLAFWGRATTSIRLADQHQTSYKDWRTRLAEMFALISDEHSLRVDIEASAEHLLATVDGLGMHILLEPGRADRATLSSIIATHLGQRRSGPS
jgi:AcrR family transcriptional regulator